MSLWFIPLYALGCAEAALSAAPAAAVPAPPVVLAQAAGEAAPTYAQPKPTVSAPEPQAETLAFEDVSDAEVVERIRSAIEAITTLQGEFTQVAPSGATSTGRFYLRRPGLIRFEYDPPSPILIVAAGGTVFVRDNALETTDSYPVNRTPLKFLLKKRVDLGDAKVLSVDRGENSVAVTLASDDDETEGDISIILSAPDLQLRQWIVRDPQNGSTFVTLKNVVAGEEIENRLFAAPKNGSALLKD